MLTKNIVSEGKRRIIPIFFCNVHKHMADEWLFTKVPDAR